MRTGLGYLRLLAHVLPPLSFLNISSHQRDNATCVACGNSQGRKGMAVRMCCPCFLPVSSASTTTTLILKSPTVSLFTKSKGSDQLNLVKVNTRKKFALLLVGVQGTPESSRETLSLAFIHPSSPLKKKKIPPKMKTLNLSSFSKLFLFLKRKPFKLVSCFPSPVLLHVGQQHVLPVLYVKGPLHFGSCSHSPLS